MLPELIDAIDWNDDESLIRAAGLLRHDEHIHTAILTGIISCAFVINLSEQTQSIEEDDFRNSMSLYRANIRSGGDQNQIPIRPTPPYSYASREDKMFAIRSSCAIGCEKTPHDDDCVIVRADQVLESVYLNHELSAGEPMAKAIGLSKIDEKPYILDIDLDYLYLFTRHD